MRHVNFSKITKSSNYANKVSLMAKSKGISYWEMMDELHPQLKSTDVK